MPSLFDLPFEDPPAPEPEPPAAPVRRGPYTVSSLTAALRGLVEEHFDEVWVEGEISNARPYNGHLYFTLKDAGAQLRGFMFASTLRRLEFKPSDGQLVLARGRLTIYDKRGEYQLVCERLEPQGLGALQAAYEQLTRRLEREGLFDAARKRALPLLPRRIGVVSSLGGAAIRDVLKVLLRRVPNASVVIADARVQGEGAAQDVGRALRALSQVAGVDVIIVARGGGSIEDLWAFNDEALARQIAACPVPVISGIGHQSDVTIADFVADLRAATPSNAAELVVRGRDEWLADLDRLRRRARTALGRRLERGRQLTLALQTRGGLGRVPLLVASARRDVQDLASRGRQALTALLARSVRRRQIATARLEAAAPARRLATMGARLARADVTLRSAVRADVDAANARLRRRLAQLEALSPLAVLGRGYAVCWDEDGRTILRRADPALEGRDVHVRLAEGTLDCRVTRARSPERPR
jgi:exodeoxyribonuclease VII large subunit